MLSLSTLENAHFSLFETKIPIAISMCSQQLICILCEKKETNENIRTSGNDFIHFIRINAKTCTLEGERESKMYYSLCEWCSTTAHQTIINLVNVHDGNQRGEWKRKKLKITIWKRNEKSKIPTRERNNLKSSSSSSNNNCNQRYVYVFTCNWELSVRMNVAGKILFRM